MCTKNNLKLVSVRELHPASPTILQSALCREIKYKNYYYKQWNLMTLLFAVCQFICHFMPSFLILTDMYKCMYNVRRGVAQNQNADLYLK